MRIIDCMSASLDSVALACYHIAFPPLDYPSTWQAVPFDTAVYLALYCLCDRSRGT